MDCQSYTDPGTRIIQFIFETSTQRSQALMLKIKSGEHVHKTTDKCRDYDGDKLSIVLILWSFFA